MDDLDLLTEWHTAFLRELKQDDDIPALRDHLVRSIEAKRTFIWKDNGVSVATVGLVMTGSGYRTNRGFIPKELRKKTYALKVMTELVPSMWEMCDYTLALVNVENVPACRLHEKFGYKMLDYCDLVSVIEDSCK